MRADIVTLFDLDPRLTHLNHGAFGAVPRRVREEQERQRAKVEAAPMYAFRHTLPEAIAHARRSVADFLEVHHDSLALVTNVTEGVAVAFDAVGLGPGDEVVVTNHGYETVAYTAQVRGAQVVTASFEMGATTDAVVAAVCAAVSERTRIVCIDQVTSPTSLVLPVRAVVEAVAPVPVYVDAAHVPGQLARPGIESLGAAFWSGNLHKWAFCPRSVAGLWVAPRWRDRARPLITSWSHGEPFPGSFDLLGTVDHSARLAAPSGIDFWHEHVGEGGIEQQRRLLEAGACLVREALGTPPVHGQLASAPCMTVVALPHGVATTAEEAQSLWRRLWAAGFVVAPTQFEGHGLLRLTVAPYNDLGDYERLAQWVSDQPDLAVGGSGRHPSR